STEHRWPRHTSARTTLAHTQAGAQAARWSRTMGDNGFSRPVRRVRDMPMEPSPNGKPRRRSDDGWLDRWVATVADLTRLTTTHPMMDAVIDEQQGRRIRIGDQWLADFASCNYLGFALEPEIIAAVPEYLAKWGTHP